MASVEQLKSGSWRAQVKKTIDGKIVRKAFTVSPKDFPGTPRESSRKAKEKAELLAREWSLNAEAEIHMITVEQAMQLYLDKKEPVLSESTIDGYYKIFKYMKKRYQDFLRKDIRALTSKDIQSLINEFVVIDKSASKTITNRIGFLNAVLDFCEIEKKFKYSIPKRIPPVLNPPEPSEFKRLLSMATPEDKIIIILAGLYTLRRGEMCGLMGEDLLWDLNSIYIHTSKVQDKERNWIRRPFPKTSRSIRVIKIDPEIMKLFPKIAPNEYLIKINPNQVTKCFEKLRAKACVNCRLHDLRKYAASIRSEFMPAKYIEADGGWSKGSNVLKTIYDKPFKEKQDMYSKKFNEHVSDEYRKELFS